MRGKRGYWKNKRGLEHETFFTMFDIILAVVVFIALLNYVVDVQKKTIFERNYLARDMALLINAVSAASGDLTYTYLESLSSSVEKHPYIFDFSGNKVGIKNLEEGNVMQYPFAENTNMRASYSPNQLAGMNALTFTKTSQGIAIKPEALAYDAQKS
jgi:hypothetical protein